MAEKISEPGFPTDSDDSSTAFNRRMLALIVLGAAAFILRFLSDPALAWGAYYSALTLWLGAAAGGVILAAIFQITDAKWAAAVRRLAEASSAFLLPAYILFLLTWFGKEHLFAWAIAPMPGREWWMQPLFVYARFTLLFGVLFFLMKRFVSLSVSKGKEPAGAADGRANLDAKLSWNAPLLIVLYAVFFSLFAFEMILGMDLRFASNLLGAHIFMGNLYFSLGVLALFSVYLSRVNSAFAAAYTSRQRWDNGLLLLGFCMIWAYFVFSQFLVIWYGNLPEETQWLIPRTRELPWRNWSWAVFSLCFVVPFILLLSRDVKRTPITLSMVSVLICAGLWMERYLMVMPQISGSRIPLSGLDILIFLGFGGTYALCAMRFLQDNPPAITNQ